MDVPPKTIYPNLIHDITANILNLFDKTIYYGTITVNNGRIDQIDRLGPERPGEPYLLPGFVDAHVHIESSLLTPPQFARLAVVHGTVATVSDPHEIGNVLGVAGVNYMIEEARRVPFKFMFGAPSCVPATTFETAGATISVQDVRKSTGHKRDWVPGRDDELSGCAAPGPRGNGKNCSGQSIQ